MLNTVYLHRVNLHCSSELYILYLIAFQSFLDNLILTLGKNIYNIAQDCNCIPSDLTKLHVKSSLTFAEVSDEIF